MGDHTTEFLERHGLAAPRCGASFGPGWTKILDELVVDLKKLGWDGYCSQIKEKFGGLRFYIGDAPAEVYTRINRAQDESFKTCEDCGEKGQLVGTRYGWLRTLCAPCMEKANEKIR